MHYNALNLQDKSTYYEDAVEIISEGPQLSFIQGRLNLTGRRFYELHEYFRELGMACGLGIDFVVDKILSLGRDTDPSSRTDRDWSIQVET